MIILLLLVGLLSGTSFAGDVRYPERRPGHVLYQLKAQISEEQRALLDRTLERYQLQSGEKDTVIHQASVGSGQSGAELPSEEQIAKELMKTGAVKFAEPDYKVYPAMTFSDPYIYYQWHHSTIKSYEAWDTTRGSPSVVVAVCDSGVQSDHPDLSGNLVLPGYNTVDGSTRTSPVNLHGTAVTGLIVAKAGNGLGVVGIAPSVKVLPVRVSNSSDGSAYLSSLSDCVRYAADRGVKVINISYTGFQSASIDSAAKYARTKGALLVMAAGNSSTNISAYPDYPSFVLAGATTSIDTRSSFSNYGTPVDIVAPGTSVVTTTVNSSYIRISGTSFSSPITAAVAALIYSVRPDFGPKDVEDVLFQSADNIGNSFYFGRGRVNAANAVKTALQWQKSTTQ